MSREAENILLLLTGISGLLISASGVYTRYVKPSLLPWLIIGSVVVIVVAVAAIARDIRDGGPAGHTHRSRVVWLLAVPVAMLIFIQPPAIGARAASPTATAVSADALRRAFPALPSGAAPEVALPDVLMRIAHDSSGSLNNRPITVTGFTMRTGDAVDLGRVVIICCAADAQLAQIRLTGPAAGVAAALPDQTWVSVEGVVSGGNDATTPTLEAWAVRPTPPPPNTYAY